MGRTKAPHTGARAAIWAGIPLCIALLSPSAAADPCARAEGAIADLLARPLEPDVALEIAARAPERSLEGLNTRAQSSAGSSAINAYMAIGLSRHAAALELLRASPPAAPGARLGYALALLALGDGTATGTVTAALAGGPPPIRRGVARALARMEQVRPRRILYEALEDPDPEVRLVAAEINVKHYSRRARRVLRALLESGPPPLAARAAQALYEVGHRFSDAETKRIPGYLRGQSLVKSTLRSRRSRLRQLRSLLPTRDVDLRAGAFAALVASGAVGPEPLRRYARVAVASRGPEAAAQLAMSLALLGEDDPKAILQTMVGPEARAAARVLWAFSAAPAPRNQLDPEVAKSLAKIVTAWSTARALPVEDEARLLEALFVADPVVGLRLARRRIAGGQDPVWQAALRILVEAGSRQDAEALLSTAPRGSPESTAWAAITAARICQRY